MYKNIRVKILATVISVFCLGTIMGQAQSGIDWKSLTEAQELAEENEKKVMIFAEAEWCGYCKKMYKEVFPEKAVQDSLEKYFYSVKLDIESDRKITFNNDLMTEKQLARQFRVSSTPTFIFLDSGGSIIGGQPGFLPAEIFDKLVAFVGMDLTGKESFKTYLKKHDVEI
ncbi:thioredoxin family protein [Fodinibius sp. Rm-B-1B1-1]|uniref:thioredoxin family protein n=1 Tax=Fodinibius alkaliphilus TaxID=3140241 RepID=UPI003159A014